MNHEPDRGTAPRRIAGSSPAFTALDLPLPLGPTTAMNRPRVPLPTEPRDQPFDEPFAAEEVDCIDSVERSQPLVRVVDRRLRLERRGL